jgi:hypothetical protein
LYAGGPRSIEVSYSDENPENPFPKQKTAFIPHGIAAPHSIAKDGNTAYAVCFYRDNPRVLRILPSHQVEVVSSPYDVLLNNLTLTDARGWVVSMDSMRFYVVSFPSNNLTLAYNIDQDHWAEWTYWNEALGIHDRHLINSACYIQGWKKQLIGDRRSTGLVYRVSNHPNDNGNRIRLEDVTGFCDFGLNGKWGFPGQLSFRVLRGAVLDDSDPSFRLSWRDNSKGGYRPEIEVSLGESTDKYFYCAPLVGLGRFKARQFKLVHDDLYSEFILVEAAFDALREGTS